MNYPWPNRNTTLLHDFGKAAGHPLDAQSLVVIIPKIFLESNIAQEIDALAQSLLLIRLPEKAGIVEASAQDALIAVANQSIRVASSIENREKMRQQFSIGIFDSKILLVVTHHRYQHFLRQIEEFGIEAAQDHRRKFGKIDDGCDQGLVFAPARARNGASRGVERFADHMLALGSA